MIALLLPVLLVQTPQINARWEEVAALPAESRIRVALDAGTVTGTLVFASDDAVALRIGTRVTTVNRTSVRAVDRLQGKAHRGRNAGIGALVGMGIGAVVYGASCKTNCMSEGAPVWTAPLGLLGAIIGAVLPDRSWHSVYRR